MKVPSLVDKTFEAVTTPQQPPYIGHRAFNSRVQLEHESVDFFSLRYNTWLGNVISVKDAIRDRSPLLRHSKGSPRRRTPNLLFLRFFERFVHTSGFYGIILAVFLSCASTMTPRLPLVTFKYIVSVVLLSGRNMLDFHTSHGFASFSRIATRVPPIRRQLVASQRASMVHCRVLLSDGTNGHIRLQRTRCRQHGLNLCLAP